MQIDSDETIENYKESLKRAVSKDTIDEDSSKHHRISPEIEYFLDAVEFEVEWLLRRSEKFFNNKSVQTSCTTIPSLVQLLGSVPIDYLVEPQTNKFVVEHKLISEQVPSKLNVRFERHSKDKFVVISPVKVYGDHLNPCLPVAIIENKPFIYLAPTMTDYNIHEIAATIAKDFEKFKCFIGCGVPMQPLSYTMTELKRYGKCAFCSDHLPNLEKYKNQDSKNEQENDEFKLLFEKITLVKKKDLIWTKDCPFSIPPVCTCGNKLSVENLSNLNLSECSILELQELHEKTVCPGICKECSGITFIPYSVIEIYLTQALSNVFFLVVNVNLPPQTVLYSDPRGLTMLIFTLSPADELDIVSRLHQNEINFAIFNVCTNNFKSSDKEYFESPVISEGISILHGPPQYLFNLKFYPVDGDLTKQQFRRCLCFFSRPEIDWQTIHLETPKNEEWFELQQKKMFELRDYLESLNDTNYKQEKSLSYLYANL